MSDIFCRSCGHKVVCLLDKGGNENWFHEGKQDERGDSDCSLYCERCSCSTPRPRIHKEVNSQILKDFLTEIKSVVERYERLVK